MPSAAPPSSRLTGRSLRGRVGEEIAAWYLRARGWSVVGRRVRVAGVEIDLVARRGRKILVVEVKTRRASEERVPVGDLVARAQRQRLETAADHLGRRWNMRVRLDLIEIRWSPWPRVRWHRGPWSP